MKHVSLGKWVDNGGDVKLDLARLLVTRLLVQANSGAGKSWLLRRLNEITAGLVQQLIIDPEGEFATLREKHDLVIISASGGDALAHPKTAALLAHRLLETQASAVLDISDLKANDRHAFVRLFLEALIEAPKALRHPVLVVLDEAQLFCPEKGQGESEASAAVIDVATRGRKRGLCLVAATQRISMLHKGVAAECKNRLIGGTSLDVDVKRAAFDLGFPPQEALKILRALEPGHFYAFGPAFKQLQPRELVTGDVQTSHPKVGHRQAAPPAPTQAILALLPKLADLPKESEERAKSMDDLRRELAQTKRELTLAKKVQPVGGPSREDLKAAETSGFSRGRESGIAAALKAIAAQRKSLNAALHKSVTVTLAEFENISEDLKLPPAPVAWSKPASERAPLTPSPKASVKSAAHSGNGSQPDGDLSGPEQRILDAAAWLESVTRKEECEQVAVAFLAGYTYGGGAFNNPRGRLNARGLVIAASDRIQLTDAGRQLAHVPETALTTEEMHRRVLDRLPGPEQRILKPLLEAYPEAMDGAAVAEAANYTFGAGAFNNPRGRLRSLGLIEYVGGQLKASGALFPEGS